MTQYTIYVCIHVRTCTYLRNRPTVGVHGVAEICIYVCNIISMECASYDNGINQSGEWMTLY